PHALGRAGPEGRGEATTATGAIAIAHHDRVLRPELAGFERDAHHPRITARTAVDAGARALDVLIGAVTTERLLLLDLAAQAHAIPAGDGRDVERLLRLGCLHAARRVAVPLVPAIRQRDLHRPTRLQSTGPHGDRHRPRPPLAHAPTLRRSLHLPARHPPVPAFICRHVSGAHLPLRALPLCRWLAAPARCGWTSHCSRSGRSWP